MQREEDFFPLDYPPKYDIGPEWPVYTVEQDRTVVTHQPAVDTVLMVPMFPLRPGERAAIEAMMAARGIKYLRTVIDVHPTAKAGGERLYGFLGW